MSCVFFFFQAEDGIRDKLVTGVQTCALPICPGLGDPDHELRVVVAEDLERQRPAQLAEERPVHLEDTAGWLPSGAHVLRGRARSEEHTSELQSLAYLVCRLLLEKKKTWTESDLDVFRDVLTTYLP